MDLAPRDGTIIEIENNAGSHPWYDIYCWQDGQGWINVRDSSRSLASAERHLRWRPYEGEIAGYVDPTKDTHVTPAPRHVSRDEMLDDSQEPSNDTDSWWDRLLGWFRPDERARPISQYLEPNDSADLDFGSPGGFEAKERTSPRGEHLGLICERTRLQAGVASSRIP
jgi:hypothetical protein